MFDMIKE